MQTSLINLTYSDTFINNAHSCVPKKGKHTVVNKYRWHGTNGELFNIMSYANIKFEREHCL